MNVEEIIRQIQVGKHDVKLALRGVVLDPIELMHRENAMTQHFNESIGFLKANKIFSEAQSLMDKFNQTYYNPNDTEETQINDLIKYVNWVSNDLVNSFENSILPFYKSCNSMIIYFNRDSRSGKKAELAIIDSIEDWPDVKTRLLDFTNLFTETVHTNKVNLLTILQEGLDDIEAIVRYEDELQISNYYVDIDPDKFLSHVLCNIRENINHHAFGIKEYSSKFLCDKIVDVRVSSNLDSIEIQIFNNGASFTGDPKRLAEYGYTHGSAKNSGRGLYSIKQTMEKMGGSASFNILLDKLVYKLTLPLWKN